MQKTCDYSMPLLPKKTKEQMRWVMFLMPPLILLIGILEYRDLMSDGVLENMEQLSIILIPGGFVVAYLCMLGGWFVKLRFAPEGIAVTLFGITLKRHSAAQIRLITAVRYHDLDRIALCNYSLEELTTRAYYAKPALMRDSREYRTGEWAYEYLLHKHPGQRDRLIYWIWWDPERLQVLRSLYPKAQWIDMTRDKIFDKQLDELYAPKAD